MLETFSGIISIDENKLLASVLTAVFLYVTIVIYEVKSSLRHVTFSGRRNICYSLNLIKVLYKR